MRQDMHWLSAVLSIIMVMNTVGCTATRRTTPETELTRRRSKITDVRGQPIEGYMDARGERHGFLGRVRSIPGDSLEFIVRKPAMFDLEQVVPDRRFTVPTDSVSALVVQRVDPVRTTLGIVAFSTITLFIVAIAAFGDFCPLCGFGQ